MAREMIISEVSATVSENIGGVGFTNMQEGPTAFQRDNKNRRSGRLFWSIQGTFGPGK
jgi:hypothetical protein